MDVLVSGQRKLAIVAANSEEFLTVRYPDRRLAPLVPSQVRMLLSDAKDFESHHVTCDGAAVFKLERACARERCLQLFLLLLDGSLEDPIRAELATALERQFETRYARVVLEAVLYSAPLSDSVDFQGAEKITREAKADEANGVVTRLAEEQKSIRRVFHLWENLPTEIFGDADGKNRWRAAATRSGFFHSVATADREYASIAVRRTADSLSSQVDAPTRWQIQVILEGIANQILEESRFESDDVGYSVNLRLDELLADAEGGFHQAPGPSEQIDSSPRCARCAAPRSGPYCQSCGARYPVGPKDRGAPAVARLLEIATSDLCDRLLEAARNSSLDSLGITEERSFDALAWILRTRPQLASRIRKLVPKLVRAWHAAGDPPAALENLLLLCAWLNPVDACSEIAWVLEEVDDDVIQSELKDRCLQALSNLPFPGTAIFERNLEDPRYSATCYEALCKRNLKHAAYFFPQFSGTMKGALGDAAVRDTLARLLFQCFDEESTEEVVAHLLCVVPSDSLDGLISHLKSLGVQVQYAGSFATMDFRVVADLRDRKHVLSRFSPSDARRLQELRDLDDPYGEGIGDASDLVTVIESLEQ